jgi:hypothetical protein
LKPGLSLINFSFNFGSELARKILAPELEENIDIEWKPSLRSFRAYTKCLFAN